MEMWYSYRHNIMFFFTINYNDNVNSVYYTVCGLYNLKVHLKCVNYLEIALVSEKVDIIYFKIIYFYCYQNV